jgi:tetratricopeptide (TPR) repeat protein
VRVSRFLAYIVAGLACAALGAPTDPVGEFERTLDARVMSNVSDLVGLAERVLAVRPDHLGARYLLGVSALEDGALNLAMRHLDQAEEIRANSSEDVFAPNMVDWRSLIAYRRAQCYGFMGRHDREQAALQDYLKLDFDQFEKGNSVEQSAVLLLIGSYVKTGRFSEAEELLRRAERDRLRGWQFERVLFERFSNPDEVEARRLLDQMIKDHGGSEQRSCPMQFVFLRAIVAMRSGQFELAEQLLEVCIKRHKEAPLFFPRLVKAQMKISAADLLGARQTLASCWTDLEAMPPIDRKDNRRRLLLAVAQFYLVAGYPEKGAAICSKLIAEPVRFGANTTQNAAGWRAALYLTALSCEKCSKTEGVVATVSTVLNCRELRARLYNEIDQMMQDHTYLRDPFDFMDGPSWLWPLLERATSGTLIAAIKAKVPFHGWRQTAYTAMLGALSSNARARPALVLQAKAMLPEKEMFTAEFLGSVIASEKDFFSILSKVRLIISENEHLGLAGPAS